MNSQNINNQNTKETPPTLTTKIHKNLQSLVHNQGQSGNWNYDPYMHGMFNGMDLMLAVLEGREPEYRSAPEHWLEDGHPTEALPPEVLARMLTNRNIFKKA